MRDKIVEILESYGVFKGSHPHEIDGYREQIADEILALVSEDEKNDSAYSGYMIGYKMGVGDTILRLQGQTDKEIAKRVIREYLEYVGGLNLVEVNHFENWLERRKNEK